jgi:hypothetical protein
MRAHSIFALVVTAIALHAPAQLCTVDMTPQQCFDKFPTAHLATSKDKAASDEMVAVGNKKMATTNTGTQSLVSPAGSAVRDFLALFAASVDSATLNESSQAVTLDWNLPFPLLGDGRTLKFQTVVAKADLNADLATALGTNADAISTLRGSLPDTGDVTFSLTANPVNQRFGRAMGPHRALLSAVMNSIPTLKDTEALALANAIADANLTDANKSFAAQAKTAAAAHDAAAAIEVSARSRQAHTQALIDVAIEPFLRLLNNQPQFYGSGIVHSRDKLVGPNEISGKVTYEMPLAANLNALYARNSKCRPDVIAAAADDQGCGAEMQALAATTGNVLASNQSRVSLAAEFHSLDKTDINLSQYNVTLQKPGSHSFTGSLTYGYVLDAKTQVTNADRIDLSLSYENISGDPTKKDRGIGALTFTKKISDTMTLPISLVYANHAQYLSNVDRKLNVHFGLSYKLPM